MNPSVTGSENLAATARRYAGGLSLGGSGICFLLGLWWLYEQEGPSSLDVSVQLAASSGQASFARCTMTLAFAAVLAVTGSISLHARLGRRSPYASGLSMALTGVAASVLLAVLALRFGLTYLAREHMGIPTDRVLAQAQQNTFDALIYFEHGSADLAGYFSWGLLATATALTCTILLRSHIWRLPAIAGLVVVAILPPLFILDSSYLFMLPFGLWELLLSGYVVLARTAQPTGSSSQPA